DQSSGFNVDTNMCAGIGIQYNDFKFDYAYHKYGSVTENDTNYLSLSYSAPAFRLAEAPPPPPPEKKEYLQITAPTDKLITHDAEVFIKGILLNVKDVGALTVNSTNAAFSSDGTFEAVYPLLLGKNSFEIKVLDSKDQITESTLESTKIRILRLAQFRDVPEGYWAKEPIELLATLGIIGGYPNGTFQPDKTINRAELTALLVRAKNPATPEAVDTAFSDVTSKHWASFFIKNGAESGLVTGYPDKTFQPAKSLNRAEGITIFSRFAELKLPKELLEGPFPDVPGRHWAAKDVSAARSAGMLMYLTDKPFEPTKELTRAEAAEILSKTPFAVLKMSSLKDFGSY
ncbi:MAG: S-layer homology domain-containing protein, partial [bacterium]